MDVLGTHRLTPFEMRYTAAVSAPRAKIAPANEIKSKTSIDKLLQVELITRCIAPANEITSRTSIDLRELVTRRIVVFGFVQLP